MTTKRIVTDAMLAAMYVVLSSFLSLSLGPMKLSLDGLPILLAALLFGPVDGLLVGFVGGMLAQLLGPYGLSVTSVLWVLPDAVRGLIAGLYARLAKQPLKTVPLGVMLVLNALVVTTLTTGAMYVDCLVFHYAFATYTPYILWRYLAGIIMAVIFTVILPPIVRLVRRAIPATTGKAGKNG